MNIVLIGYRGCGKTTAGRLAAQRMGWPFVDTDALTEQRAGMTIRDIYARHGEQHFRQLESEVVHEISQYDHQLISTGGGVLLTYPETAQALKDCGKIVWLTAPAEVLWRRINADPVRQTGRPASDPATGWESFQQAMAERESLYKQWADVVLDIEQDAPQAVAQKILSVAGLPKPKPQGRA